MKHAENDYISAGYQYERGKTTADKIRAMLESEHVNDKPEARRLIEQGRSEARQGQR